MTKKFNSSILHQIEYGSYLPTSYIINIDIGKVENISHDKDTFFTFAHEYIHYLQDISTVFCFQRFFREWIALSRIFSDLTPLQMINLPLEIPHNTQEEIDNIYEFLFYLSGGYYNMPSSEATKILPHTRKFRVNLTTYVKNDTPFSGTAINLDNEAQYVVGGDCIMEGMAYTAEKILGNTQKLGFVPYEIIRKVITDNIGPTKEEIMYIIMELALLDEIPQYRFPVIINKIKKNPSILNNKPIDIYHELFSFLNKDGEIKKSFDSIISSFAEIEKITKGTIFYDSIITFKVNLSNIFKKRLYGFSTLELLENKQIFLSKLKEIQSPLIKDETKKIKHINSSDDEQQIDKYLFFLFLKHIFHALYNRGISPCPYFFNCNSDNKSCQKCSSSPWDYIEDPNCILSNIFIGLGFKKGQINL